MRSCGVHCSKLFTLESGPFLNGIQFSYCSSSRIYWECPTLIHRIIINRNQIGRGRHVMGLIGIILLGLTAMFKAVDFIVS